MFVTVYSVCHGVFCHAVFYHIILYLSPGLWFIPCAVSGYRPITEYKALKGSDDDPYWEAHPYWNKTLSLNANPQLFVSKWGNTSIDFTGEILLLE